jgi:tetratricopeptide (TPR) repeat protein
VTPDDARRLLADGRVEHAEAACAALMRIDPRQPEALHVMGLVRFQQQRLDEAAFLLSAAAELSNGSGVLSDLAAVHLAQGRGPEAVADLERALSIDPGNAAGWCLLGFAYEAQQDAPMAVRCFSHATRIDPRNADAWAHLAALQAADGRSAEAIASLRACLDADRAQPEVWNNLGVLLDGQAALDCFDEALALRPAYADAHYNRGNALRLADRPDDAASAFQAALALDPSRTDAAHNLAAALLEANRPLEAAARFARTQGDEARFGEALSLLVSGDLAAGFEKYESRVALPSVFAPRHEALPRWRGEDLRGRGIVVYEEQGLGDTIQFLRYAPLLADRGAKVVVEVSPVLLELAQTLRGPLQVVAPGGRLPRCQFQSPVMSLPRAFGTVLQTIPGRCPYLRPPPTRTQSWAGRLPAADGRLRVGVAWSGRPSFVNDRRRSMRLETLAPLLARRDCLFHVLQTGVRDEDQAWLAGHPEVFDAGRRFVDLSDTAAVAAMMDVVISVDTSVAHLAGALATPVWVMLPHAPDWRWLLEREDSPWYPTARLFRQVSPGGWDDVVRRVGAALDELSGEI